ncbi:DUF1565 domain-containing protein [Calothrix sp. NIES-3974]|uniref:DUF1565 domain-containing protein n=1 Tax=Calothrix sp. NIES-3974 TaxID=2005462 RepID=UPI000B609275|nr:DUF1565 domain-containing protein [Calothrix sp. NIES-3974]BAZ03768.1 hypothetical protein NIES3974_03980 [Calothrix sp. NIES-3974]
MTNTIYVNPVTGNDSGNAGNSPQAPFKTITRALRGAVPGTTIQLSNGTYNTDSGEVYPLTPPEGVKILGNEANKGSGILIQGSGNFLSRTFARQNVTFVLTNRSELRGVTVTNPETRGTGVWIESTAPIVANCTLTKCKREGIFITGEGNPQILHNNLIENDANGIAIANNAKGIIQGNTCLRTGFGIVVNGAATPSLIGNRTTENRTGLIFYDDSRPALRDNISDRNTQDGMTLLGNVQVDFGSTSSPGGNIFRDNGQFDIQNASNNQLVSVGNQVNPSRTRGNIQFVDTQTPTPVPPPNPTPVPIPVPPPNPTPEPAPVPIPVPTPTPTPPSSNLTDISGHWAEKFIRELNQREIIIGFRDRTFKPDATITRAQFAALIVKAFNPRPIRQGKKFRDVSDNFWANEVIQKAYESGFLSGYPDNTFHPNQNIPRVQVIVSLVNGAGVNAAYSQNLTRFDDYTDIPAYAKEQVLIALNNRIIVNYPNLNKLNPNRDATRAEVTVMVYQVLAGQNRVAAISSPYLV